MNNLTAGWVWTRVLMLCNRPLYPLHLCLLKEKTLLWQRLSCKIRCEAKKSTKVWIWWEETKHDAENWLGGTLRWSWSLEAKIFAFSTVIIASRTNALALKQLSLSTHIHTYRHNTLDTSHTHIQTHAHTHARMHALLHTRRTFQQMSLPRWQL